MAKSAKRSASVTAAPTLADKVEISRQFLRSVRLDADFGRLDALDGYVFQGTARAALESMAKQLLETQQRAFTWTGPYGGGKSSLALALASLVSRDPKLRAKARRVLNIESNDPIAKAFAPGKEGWTVVPVVGRRARVEECLTQAWSHATGAKLRLKGQRGVIDALVVTAEQPGGEGVLVIIDELGKFLEASALNGDDVFFYQELAEAASRAKGRLVVVGVLHQAFEAYASRLGRDARDEWAKVQGRFVDIPLVAGTDEVVELVGRAITVDGSLETAGALELAEKVARSIKRRRPASPGSLAQSLHRCWPLHPATAALLGPVSRRRFGQNERSTFGFLASKEPLGFIEFLRGAPLRWQSMFAPAHYWDYLRANLEPAILASPDGHRWAMSADAVARAEAKGTPVHVEIAKTVALIDLFRNGSGLAADDAVVLSAMPQADKDAVRSALEDLAKWSILIFRKHLDAWGVYAGSDFDIDAAVSRARGAIGELDVGRISSLADLQPVVAKRLYYQTGTLRWLTRNIVSEGDAERYVKQYQPAKGSAGEFLLVLPEVGRSQRKHEETARRLAGVGAQEGLLVGIPRDSTGVIDLALELAALEHVYAASPELEGDLVARREIESRLGVTKVSLGEALRDAFGSARWFEHGQAAQDSSASGLAAMASEVARRIYAQAPQLFSEMLNRDRPSSNAVKARRDLLYRMMSHGSEENLGYEGFSSDAGLYYTLLRSTGLHRQVDDGAWGFASPCEKPGEAADHNRAASLQAVWAKTLALLSQSEAAVTLDAIYRVWQAPPFGVREGVCPVLAVAFFLANRQKVAVYIENVFVPELSEAQIDEWMQDERRVSFRLVSLGADENAFLVGLAEVAGRVSGRAVAPEPLDVARALVSAVVSLPPWAKRTSTVSSRAQFLRGLLLRANDPNKVIFSDLPASLSDKETDLVSTVGADLDELCGAYAAMLAGVEKKMLRALDHSEGFDALRDRASAISGISGDFQLNAFIGRLSTYNGGIGDIEGLVGLAASKSPRDWVDRDIDAAVLKLADWAYQFRRVETLASFQGRSAKRHALGVVFGGEEGKVVSESVEVAERDRSSIDVLAKALLAVAQSQRRDVALAALAQVGAHLVQQQETES